MLVTVEGLDVVLSLVLSWLVVAVISSVSVGSVVLTLKLEISSNSLLLSSLRAANLLVFEPKGGGDGMVWGGCLGLSEGSRALGLSVSVVMVVVAVSAGGCWG